MHVPHTRRIHGFIFAVCALFLMLVAFGIHAEWERDADFFRSSLRDVAVDESVTIHGSTYRVEKGVVSRLPSGSISIREKLDALMLVYAITLARRSPVFGLEGVDPDALRDSVSELAQAQEELSQAQSPGDQKSVREALYPIRFLSALADLEEARQTLLISRSDADELRYERALSRAARTGVGDLSLFKSSLQDVVLKAGIQRYPTFGGTITTNALLNGVDSIHKRMSEAVQTIRSRAGCVHGNTSLCKTNEMVVTLPNVEGKPLEPHMFSRAREIQEISAEAAHSSGERNEKPIALSTSMCLNQLPGPYLVTLEDVVGDGIPIKFLGNLFFYPTEVSNNKALEYLKSTYDISWDPFNPMNFYQCPEVGDDLGRAFAVRRTVDFAQSHRTLAPKSARQLLGAPVFYESDAISYIREAMIDATRHGTPSEQEQLNSLSLVYSERSEGFADLIHSVASVGMRDAELKQAGVPFDVRSERLFLTHSAFYSLFLSQNSSAGNSPVFLREEDRVSEHDFQQFIARYSELRTHVPREKIVHDLRQHIVFESLRASP